KQALVPCAAVRRPGTFGGLDVLTVLTVDLDRGLPAVDSDAVLMSGETVYASAESLFVATGSFRSGDLGGPTEIHRFSIEGSTTSYEASGSVQGTMLSQFSMSEHEGVLRVASTKEPNGSGRNRRASQSFVTTLAQSGGELLPVGQVGGLGRGERIYAVRFLGDTGYVVTFRQVDPLYTLDLSVPSAPRVLGELTVRGYSAYLHPVGTDRLIGVGQDATPDGFTRGTQVSLFDVSNLAAPALLSRAKLGGDSSSEVEFDHRAFLYWEPASLVVIPASVYGTRDSRPSFEGAVAFRTSGGVQEVARLTHGPDPPPISRAIVNSGRLITVSQRGVLVSDIDALTPLGWVPF
nr:beta-propeller domain-containing protein [Solirubrobacterales bacterium]